MRAGRTASHKTAALVPAVKREVQAKRHINVRRSSQERQHAEREAHEKAEQIKIRPGHTAPRAHSLCASWNRDADHPYCKLIRSLRRRMPSARSAGLILLRRIDAGPQDLVQPVRQAR